MGSTGLPTEHTTNVMIATGAAKPPPLRPAWWTFVHSVFVPMVCSNWGMGQGGGQGARLFWDRLLGPAAPHHAPSYSMLDVCMTPHSGKGQLGGSTCWLRPLVGLNGGVAVHDAGVMIQSGVLLLVHRHPLNPWRVLPHTLHSTRVPSLSQGGLSPEVPNTLRCVTREQGNW